MSNKVTFEPTKFENVRTGHTTLGYRAYDDEGQAYDNTFDSIPDSDMEFLGLVNLTDNKEVRTMIDFIIEHEKGCEIGGTWYDWEDIKDVIGDDQKCF